MTLPMVAQVAMPVIKKTLGKKLLAGIGKLATSKVAGALGTAALQHRHNKKLAQYSFDRNVEMWKMQNEYNSPAQQMARFKSAGLNPQMIYDKGTAGNAQTMPQYQQLPTSGDVFGQSIAGIQGLIGIKQKQLEVDAAKLGIDHQTYINGITKLELEYKDAINDERIDKYKSEVAVQFFNEQLKIIEANRTKYGIDGATTEYKIFFSWMMDNFTEKQLEDYVLGMGITAVGYNAAKGILPIALINRLKKQGGFK